MTIKINDVELTEYPSEFSVTVLDIDNGESSARAADGTLNRDRITTKRKIEMSWGLITWNKLASILQSTADTFFTVYYPDPMEGTHVTKTFYAGDRPSLIAVANGSEILWSGLKMSLTER